MRRLCSVLALTLLPGAAQAAGEVCVQNGTAADYLFTIELFTFENATGARARASLSPGAELCLSAAGARAGGVVAVYERADSIEGCSRIVGEAGRDALLAYGAFDRCRWASHGN